jgi:threonyl-tRNA synthetase (EC 6.1.1.3)/Ser-tRNA(Thr) hydrolase (EC 3.1.1.-)
MLNISFPDGSIRQFPKNITGLAIAESISKSLAKDAVAVRVNQELWDLSRAIETDAAIEIITKKQQEALEILRHDAAHLMAQAVQELYPGTQVTIGPAIENGFYYDFYREESFTPEDLAKIEARMRALVEEDIPIIREVWNRDEAIQFFKSIGEGYKAEIIESIPSNDAITLYRQGNFIDLCRGPHLPSTGRIGKAFKLMKLAGAYWRGDSNNAMLQRIYGTAWANEQQLQEHLIQLEEAEKRDHRKLGRALGLFHQQEETPGAVFWHPKGWTVYQILKKYIQTRLEQENYVEVNTPILVDRKFWERSGHWEKFREHMFTTEDADEERIMAMKPMNCPCHVQIFKHGIKSYRDLPLRMAEFGSCHRNEPSGALHGLMRVRAFVQDDAHIFCTEEQIISETQAFCDLLKSVYQDLGFTDLHVKFSDRNAIWDQAEAALMAATKAAGLDFTLNPGEGAFYGPKLEFVLKDAIGRDWQCGTLQVDFVLPERLDATYIDEHGQKRRPVMLHRAILGSFERFIAILIENYAGKFPLWLAPTQVMVVPISAENNEYAQVVLAQLKAAGLRAETDLRNEKMTYKIREHSNAKVPAIFVVGRREAEEQTVAIRWLGSEQQEVLALQQAVVKLKEEARSPAEREVQ